MALIGISKDEVAEFVSTFDKDKTNPTVFELRPLTNEQRVAIFDKLYDEKGSITTRAIIKNASDILAAGVKQVRNVTSKDGTALTITDHTRICDMFTMAVIIEVAQEIIASNMLSDAERKN